MKYVILKKSDFNEFIAQLTRINTVVAPVAKGYNNFAFQEIHSGKEISLTYIPTILPPKKYFMPQVEKVVQFNKANAEMKGIVEYDKLILFGVHTCDLAGIQCLNMVFSLEPQDPNYNKRKDNIILIGLECNTYCDTFASCAEMGNHLPKGGYDLFMTDLGDRYIIHVQTSTGSELITKIKLFADANQKDTADLENLRTRKKDIFKDEVEVKETELKSLFENSKDSKTWDSLDKRCLSCGNCTNVCPTCYCFDLVDDINLDLNTGVRLRKWDSCQTETFAQVAGGENFREERGDRQKHRYMRKFTYPFNKYNRHFCTGCGRCSRTCMAKINLKETINELAKESLITK